MSVLIKGMEMPKNCAECPVNLYVCQRGYEYLLEHPELYDQRADDCPISYVPPHGRLIDADELMELYADADDMHLGNMKVPIAVIRQNIMDAPTIIPAEEGE